MLHNLDYYLALQKVSCRNEENKVQYPRYFSFDQKQYKTCHLEVLKGKVPCQAVCNNLYLDEIPPRTSPFRET